MRANYKSHQPRILSRSTLISVAALILLACSQSAMAQATPNKIPKWTDNAGALGPSTILEDANGNVGIGTSTPNNTLELFSSSVNSAVRVNGKVTGAAYFFNSQSGLGQDRATVSVNAFYNGSAWSYVNSALPSWALQLRINEDDFQIGRGNAGYPPATTLFNINNLGNAGIGTSRQLSKLDVVGGVAIGSYAASAAAPSNGLIVSGNVGIGITTPTVPLHVVGDGKFTGNITVDGNINAKFQDVAEWVPSSEKLPTGTVVVLDATKSNQVIASTVSYDTRVAGVISEQPGIALGEKGESKVLVATTGRVRVKVEATRGQIHIGDLLVTSDVPGVAMKSEPVNLGGVQFHRPGTLIGKALEPLEKGSGAILVLLSLQ